MRKRKLVLFVLMCCMVSLPVFAGGRKANESHEASDPAGFTESININEKKSGKWNIYLEAQDKGGNKTIAGPHNIYLDPASDLPIARIINPRPNMHVQGNLNIVGTCMDDDGVAYTELVINKGKDESGDVMIRTRAEGSEFWSYYLDTSDTATWRDGLYTITVWGVDINGLSGISDSFPAKIHKKHQVSFNLDRKKPEIKVTSHALGALLSGKVTLKGTIWDGNGIDSLSYSLDNGVSYKSAGLKYDNKNDIYNFDLAIDTKIFEDGAALIEFKSKDKMMTEGVLSFLIFANNTGPELEIVYPGPNEAVNGLFTVAGYANHNVGLASLSWKMGKESGEIDMIKGNPWWAQELDIRGQNTKSVDLEITAVDLSGNRTVVRRKLPVDQEADKPKITVNEPQAGMIVSGSEMKLVGAAVDNDGVQSIFYSLNGAPPTEVPCSGYFQLVVGNIPLGINNLEVWAKDITDVIGPKTLIKGIIAPGPAPVLTIDKVLSTAGKSVTEKSDFHSGVEVSSESGEALRLQVYSGSVLQSLGYKLGSKEPVEIPVKGNKGGDYTQNIPIPADIDYGLVQIEITAKDIYGRGEPLVEYIYVTDYSAPRVIDGYSPVNRIGTGVNLVGLMGEASWPGQIRIPRGTKIPISATVDPVLAQGARIEFKLRSVINVVERPSITAAAGKDGTVQAFLPADLTPDLYQVSLVITQKTGESQEAAREFWLLRPLGDNQRLNTGESFTWVRPDTTTVGDGRILLAGGQPLTGIYTGRSLRNVEIEGDAASSFRAFVDSHGQVSLSGSEDGSYALRLSLTDRDGKNFTTGEYRFLVSGNDPELEFTENPEGKWLQERIPVKFQMRSRIGIKSVDFSIDMGTSWHQLLKNDEIGQMAPGSPIERVLDISSLDDGAINLSLRVMDEANRFTVRSFTVHKDTKAPETRVIVPVSGARVNGRIRMGIAIKEAGKLAFVNYENPGSGEPGGSDVPYRAPISKQVYPSAEKGDLPLYFLYMEIDPTIPLSENMSFVFTDMAGNTSTLSSWPFIIDEEMDLPTAHISLPIEDEVITSDFLVSGVCFDDDEVSRIYWCIDDGSENVLESTHGYSIPITLASMTDNEHSVTIYAEDMYGVRGLPVTRNFRVSLTEPKAAVVYPALGEIVGGTVQISGTASDENGIGKIQVSLNNGNSFNNGEGAEEWTYTFNSKILPDGPNVVFVRVWDKYDINALYASMLVVDNTPPELVVETPIDGAVTTGPIYITGQAVDKIMLESIVIKLSSLEGIEVPPGLTEVNVKPDSILLEEMDLGTLPDGTYNIEIWATDKAQNVSRISRNIQLEKDNQRNFVDNLYPLNGECVQGNFNLYGYVGGIDTATEVTMVVNGVTGQTVPVTEAGYYRFAIGPEDLRPGTNSITVRSDFGGKERVESSGRILEYMPYGPWVTVDTMNMGDFAYERPYLMGRAGYELSEEDRAVLADKKADKELRAAAEAKKLKAIELSFDNGFSFFEAGKARTKGFDWRYRLETQDMAEGIHYLIVRATMQNDETAITSLIIQVDKTPPRIRLISPEMGGRYNETLEFSALATDDTELRSFGYHLRKGDKSAYEIPGFIKGLYLEATIPPIIKWIWNSAPVLFAGGPTFFDIGLGLSFFDDNVKIQMNYGLMTQKMYEGLGGEGLVRYGGHVLGLKILANVYTLPFAVFGGPDWEWLSASFALGANFSFFDLGKQGYTQSGNPTWMSAIVAQIEFPKVTIPKRSYLRTFSMFTEGQLWFVPTDVNAAANKLKTVFPHVIIGLRMYIF